MNDHSVAEGVLWTINVYVVREQRGMSMMSEEALIKVCAARLLAPLNLGPNSIAHLIRR